MRSVAVAAVIASAFALSGPSRDAYVLTTLVTDRGDAQLVNAWGLAASSTGPWWTANEARESSSVYGGDGRKQLLTVHVEGGPTGVAFYGGRGFVIRGGGRSDGAACPRAPA